MNHNMICEGRLKTGEAAFGAAEQVWWYKRTILRSARVADIGDHAKRRVLVLISAGAQTQLVLQWRNSGECMQLHQTSQNYQILVISCLVGTQVLVQATQEAQTQLVLQQPSGETLVRPKSSSSTRKAPGTVEKRHQPRAAAAATTRKFLDNSQFRWRRLSAGWRRHSEGGGAQPFWWGVGGCWGGRAPPRLIHPTTPPAEP